MLKILLLSALLASPVHAAKNNETPDRLLEESQKQFYRNDHDGALGTLQKYFAKLTDGPKQKIKTKLRFLAIAAMGRIYLQYKQDPDGAIKWFEKMGKADGLTEAEQDIVQGWIAVAQDWKKLGKKPDASMSEEDLFAIGKKYYDAGMKKQKFITDPAATADFSIAYTYLVPLLANHDKNSHVGDSLFMMGDMRRRLWSNNSYWSENAYLTEAVRRFPNTPLAIKSYEALKEEIDFAYSGSSGEHVPQSWKDTLNVLSRIAHGKESATPDSKPASTPKTTATPKLN